MLTYFIMKRRQWKIKAMFYGAILDIAKPVTEMLLEIPTEELQDNLIDAIAKIVHSQNQKKDEK